MKQTRCRNSGALLFSLTVGEKAQAQDSKKIVELEDKLARLEALVKELVKE